MPGFEVAAYRHPLRNEGAYFATIDEEITIAELILRANVDPRFYRDLEVVISKGTQSAVIPMEYWARVRPNAGSHVWIGPKVRGPAVAAIIAAALPTVASTVAGTIAGLAAGTIGYALVYTAVTIVGTLLINALVPPPTKPETQEDETNFSITGTGNAENRYGVYPTVLGRHLIYPPKTARGYTEGVGDDIYYRGRFTFGYGPVALESLRIGTTPITDFEGVELEFLNVDRTETLKHYPELASITRAWRTGSESLTLYPDDIAEEHETVVLDFDVPVVRRTRERAISASVDVSFQGLAWTDDKGRRVELSVHVFYTYRKVGDVHWAPAVERKYTAGVYSHLRFTEVLNFPEEGEYEVRLWRGNPPSTGDGARDEAVLTAIRSVQAGKLPSHPEVAEMAIRIKASEELNGQVDSLNAIALQMAPVWTGAEWTAPQPVRHPAWVYARALTGPMSNQAVGAHRLVPDDLKDWADQEPHWTVDAVIDQPTTMAEVLDIICGAGRARRTMRDLKYTIIRDGGVGPVVQQYSPRNSWGFQGAIQFPKEIHGFRVRCYSEHLEWQQDEITVYADGYHAGNATEFETLDLRGVVLSKNDADGGNAWRLGRYHLAQAILRPEEFTWQSDLDHLRVNMGDKVRLVHDVPLVGVGAGRIQYYEVNGEGNLELLALDELLSLDGAQYRMIVRQRDGTELVFMARPPTSHDGLWEVVDSVSAEKVNLGDLVSVEEMTQESMEVLVTSIRHSGNLQATLTGVPAAPEVLLADQGEIPPYEPIITKVKPRHLEPASPVIAQADLVIVYDPARVVARIKIAEYDRFEHAKYHVRLIGPDGVSVPFGPFNSGDFDIPLPKLGRYEVRARRETTDGKITAAAVADVDWRYAFTEPEVVENFRADIAGHHVTLTWAADDPLVHHYVIKHLPPNADGGWSQAALVVGNVTGGTATVPGLPGTYLIRAVSHWDQESPEAVVINIPVGAIEPLNVVAQVVEHPSFEGNRSAALGVSGGKLILGAETRMSEWPKLSEVGWLSTFNQDTATGEYEFADVFDLSEVYTSRLTAEVDAAAYPINNRMSGWGRLSTLASLSGKLADSEWDATLYIQTTLDDPNDAGAVWGDWEEFRAGDYLARGYRFKLSVARYARTTRLEVKGLSVQIDMPDRTAGGPDVTCPAEGVYVAFDPPFKEVPAITVTGQELPVLHRGIRTQVSRAGFHQQFVDENGAGLACTFDWDATGYGRAI